jgi:hypothetical protein
MTRAEQLLLRERLLRLGFASAVRAYPDRHQRDELPLVRWR